MDPNLGTPRAAPSRHVGIHIWQTKATASLNMTRNELEQELTSKDTMETMTKLFMKNCPKVGPVMRNS